MEEWRKIKGYGKDYECSSLGRVRSFKRESVVVLTPTQELNGYVSVGLSMDGVQCKILIHTLIAETFLGYERKGHTTVCDHINSDKTDNRLANLQVISNRENVSRSKINKSGFTGVRWRADRGKWVAYAQVDGKIRYFGHYNTKEAARVARLEGLNNYR